VNGRYAPSPTGVLHLGNLRTALLAWLFARSAGSRFVLRIEDLDTGRVRPEFYAEQQRDLRRIGLDWDACDVQSQYASEHEEALSRLPVYECFCTRAEIREAASAAHGPVGVYPGTCLGLSEAERAARRAAGREPALRVRAGAARVRFVDRLCGPQDAIVDDFVVRRNDGAHAYNLAVVIDDHRAQVEEVVRGDDLLDSTPRQIWLYRMLGLPEPSYAHVPLVLGPDGNRLAKRHRSVTLRELEVDDALAWMARSLGYRGRTPAEMLEEFDPAQLPREPTVFAP
jgi:glutamyl-tRNA synthetase